MQSCGKCCLSSLSMRLSERHHTVLRTQDASNKVKEIISKIMIMVHRSLAAPRSDKLTRCARQVHACTHACNIYEGEGAPLLLSCQARLYVHKACSQQRRDAAARCSDGACSSSRTKRHHRHHRRRHSRCASMHELRQRHAGGQRRSGGKGAESASGCGWRSHSPAHAKTLHCRRQ